MKKDDWVENNGQNEIPVGVRLLLQVSGMKKKKQVKHHILIGAFDENWGWYLDNEKELNSFVVEAWQELPEKLIRERSYEHVGYSSGNDGKPDNGGSDGGAEKLHG